MDTQIEHILNRPTTSETPIMSQIKKWKKSFITALITFTLNTWNDRCQTVHGETPTTSHPEYIAHLHQSIRIEYDLHDQTQHTIMEPHFHLTLQKILKKPLRYLKFWLQRLQATKTRLNLLTEAKDKISTLQAECIYVDVERVLSLSNRDLSRWITSTSSQESQGQTVLEQHFILLR